MEQNIQRQIIDYKLEEIIDLQEIINNLDKYNITEISISNNIIYENKTGQLIKFIKTDYEHPLRITPKIFGKGNKIEINEEYLLNNQGQIINLIKFICKNSKKDNIEISDKALITLDVLKAIIENNNLKEVELTSRYESNQENKYELTKEIYEMFKKAQVPKEIITPSVSEELKDNFDPMIYFNKEKRLIGYNKYKDLQDNKTLLYIDKNLSEEQINNLKYICPNKKIIIKLNDYNKVEKILDKLLELNNNAIITLNLEDKELFNNSNIYKNSEKYTNLDITISNDSNTVALQVYKRFEKILYDFIKPALENNYSPFEKYIFAYNLTKQFKEYKEVEENQDKMDSRNLYSILENEYMVCVGYKNLLSDLLNKLGIPSVYKSVDISVNEPTEDVKFAGHARAYVHLQDQKYGIDGFYIADPTWDNDMERDFYNYLAVTNEEMNHDHMKQGTGLKTKFKSIIDKNILFDFTDLNDFYQRINYIINQKINIYIENCKSRKEVYNIKEEISYVYLNIINKILEEIRILDIKTYTTIVEKYDIRNKSSSQAIELYAIYPTIIEELGEYLVSKINKPISGKTIIDAAMVVKKDSLKLTEEEAEIYRQNLIEINRRRQAAAFPKITIENVRTGEVTYENAENKFDLEEYQQISGKVK